MTTLEVKLDLPDRLAREAQAVADTPVDGTPAQGCGTQAGRAGSEPLSMDEIQAEVNAVRRSRKANASA